MTIAVQTLRDVDGRDVPVAGQWVIDSSHSQVEFVVRHLITKVRGRFGSFSGEITIADVPEASSVVATVDASSITTGEKARDEHLRSADFLDTGAHPTLDFHSTGLRADRGNRWFLDGDLTIRGITRATTFDLEFDGGGVDPWGNAKIGFTAVTEINREDFGLTWNQVAETGGFLVGRTVKIELSVQAGRA